MTFNQQAIRTQKRARAYQLLSESFKSPDKNYLIRLSELEWVLKKLHSDIRPDFFKSDYSRPPYSESTLTSSGSDESEDEKEGRMAQMHAISLRDLELLKVEHARLFVGPFSLPAPPYGSIYLDQNAQLMAASTLDALQWYKSEGLDIAIKDAPDHICIELEFMYLLVYRELKALEMMDPKARSPEEQDPSREASDMEPPTMADPSMQEQGADFPLATQLREKQRHFLEQHVGRWIHEFESKVHEHAGIPLFDELAIATRKYIDADLQELRRFA